MEHLPFHAYSLACMSAECVFFSAKRTWAQTAPKRFASQCKWQAPRHLCYTTADTKCGRSLAWPSLQFIANFGKTTSRIGFMICDSCFVCLILSNIFHSTVDINCRHCHRCFFSRTFSPAKQRNMNRPDRVASINIFHWLHMCGFVKWSVLRMRLHTRHLCSIIRPLSGSPLWVASRQSNRLGYTNSIAHSPDILDIGINVRLPSLHGRRRCVFLWQNCAPQDMQICSDVLACHIISTNI